MDRNIDGKKIGRRFIGMFLPSIFLPWLSGVRIRVNLSSSVVYLLFSIPLPRIPCLCHKNAKIRATAVVLIGPRNNSSPRQTRLDSGGSQRVRFPISAFYFLL